MLFAYYACPKCQTRIGIQSNRTEVKKLQEFKHNKVTKPINIKIFQCPLCNQLEWFDYVGYMEI